MNTYAVVGLGYVGLGLAVGLGKKHHVIGYDIHVGRIEELNKGIDRHKLVDASELRDADIFFTHEINDIKQATFYIVSVSTPAYCYEMPDLKPLMHATEQIGRVLKKGDIVVFESTVYPTTTEEICIPILEKASALQRGRDFQVGYSPERINPGDAIHTLKNITKIIAAQDKKTLKVIHDTYASICENVYPVSSIATAEAIKILENTQRDVNIALMNEFAKVMHAINLDVHEIIEGAKTKWSFVPYKPGFVGGHCISIDPHYLAFLAKRKGVQPELILAARRVNDGMTQFVIQSMLKLLIKNKIDTKDLSIGIFGISYKENVVDARNSLSLKLIKELREYGFTCRVHDPLEYKISGELHDVSLEAFDHLDGLSLAIMVVGHDFYRDKLGQILKKCTHKIVLDIPNVYQEEAEKYPMIYWRL